MFLLTTFLVKLDYLEVEDRSAYSTFHRDKNTRITVTFNERSNMRLRSRDTFINNFDLMCQHGKICAFTAPLRLASRTSRSVMQFHVANFNVRRFRDGKSQSGSSYSSGTNAWDSSRVATERRRKNPVSLESRLSGCAPVRETLLLST